MNFVFYGLLLVFLGILFQEILIVDEEMILIISVLIFLGSSYNVVSSFLMTSLSERADGIRKTFDNYFILKTTTLTTLLNTYQRIYDTNIDLVKVIGITSNSLQDIRTLRNKEVEHFFNFIINQQLHFIITEEINLLRVLYYNKIKFFFNNLLKSWKLYEIRGLVNEDVFDEFTNASKIINNKKLSLLPLSSMNSNDLVLFSSIDSLRNVIGNLGLDSNFLVSYLLVNLLIGVRSIK